MGAECWLEEAVLAYREEYLIERSFNRYRGEILGLTLLYLSSTTRIEGSSASFASVYGCCV